MMAGRMMTETEIVSIIAGIERLNVMLQAQNDKFEKLEHRLLGNGQPGEIEKIGRRLDVLEEFKYTLFGAASFLGVIGAFVVELIRWSITGRR
jgi:hypothetical protein